jgi:hypothetical protein
MRGALAVELGYRHGRNPNNSSPSAGRRGASHPRPALHSTDNKGDDHTLYVADERSEKAAKVALQLLSLKFAVDMAEALKDPAKLAEILSL